MFKKRGQVTIFIMVGVLILLSVLSFWFLSGDFSKTKLEVAKKTTFSEIQIGSTVQNYVEKCIEKTGEDAIVYIGKQGGYYQLPKLYDPNFRLPYYFYEQENKIISRRELEKQLSLYLNDNLYFCLRQFSSFKQQGYQIDQGEIKTKVKVAARSVLFKVRFPVYLIKGNLGKELTLFEAKVPSRMNDIHKTVYLFMQEQEKKNDSICLSCLTKLAIDSDLRVEISPDNNTVLFTVIDENVKIKKEDYHYEFLNQYRWGKEVEVIKAK